MEAPSKLKPPDIFKFPFTPYDIQHQFMHALFNVLESGKLGIFESPTGTGKSLSLICGALTWFLSSEKHRRSYLENLVNDKATFDNDDDDDWFAAAGRKQEHNQKRLEAKQELENIDARTAKLSKIKAKRNQLKQAEIEYQKDEFDELFKEVKWIQKAVQREISQGAGDEDILVEEYFSDEEGGGEDSEEEDTSRRIFFCSRTHSQLSQFVREVKKSPFGSEVSLVSLASRAVMCVNPIVKKLPSQAAINEKCLELGRKKSRPTALDVDENPTKKAKSSSGCPYNKNTGTSVLRDQAVLSIHDIEELVTAGRKTQSCPYYASRSAVPLAQMVVLPYNTLLHASTRKALGRCYHYYSSNFVRFYLFCSF